MVTLEADKRETKAWRSFMASFLNKLGSHLSLRASMAIGDEIEIKWVYIEMLWTLPPHPASALEQSLKKKEKAYLRKLLSPLIISPRKMAL